MIYLEQITGHDLSLRVQTRAKYCSAVKDRRQQGVYRVTPMTKGFAAHHGKAKRRVQFGLHRDRVFIMCWDWSTMEPCPANFQGMVCAHVYKAYLTFLKNAEKENK